MTDVAGVLHNKDDPSTLYRALDIRQCRTLIEEGVIAGGMIPKVSLYADGCFPPRRHGSALQQPSDQNSTIHCYGSILNLQLVSNNPRFV